MLGGGKVRVVTAALAGDQVFWKRNGDASLFPGLNYHIEKPAVSCGCIMNIISSFKKMC